ncbi:MAG: hypothetical protein N2486_01950 [Caloramator sp.]|nr:hypothetical protein [Caloramator sp.]
MENEILLKAIEKLLDKKLDEKLEPIKKDIAELKADVSSLKSDVESIKSDIANIKVTQQTILTFVQEVDKEFYKVEETYKFMNDLKKAFNQ